MKFQYFTFFVNQLNQLQLIPDKRPKKEILRSILEQNLEFKHRGSQLAYVFLKSEGDYILSKIGKKSLLRKTLPPSHKFQETQEENWPHCYLLINLSGDPDSGQRIAFEIKSYVFYNPLEQLRAFSDEINAKLFSSGYTISINPITQEQKFWQLAKENSNKIRKLSLVLNAPNLFNMKGALDDELKDLQKEFSLTKTTVEFENPSGQLTIPEGNNFLKQGVEYITRGGGEYKLTLKSKKIISSRKNIVSKSFEDFEVNLEAKDKTTILEALDKIFK